MRIKPLPYWVVADSEPAFYETEGATAIQMVAKLYGKVKELISDYNTFVDEINEHIREYEEDMDASFEDFKNDITDTMNDYIASVDLKLSLQDDKIDEAVLYMKTNIVSTVTSIIEEMKESGELDEAIVEAFDNLSTRVAGLESTLNDTVQEVTDLANELESYEQQTDTDLTSIHSQLTGLTSPYVIVDNVGDMVNPNKIYINTTDNNWYYYNGTEFVIGGSVSIDPTDIQNLKYENLDSSLRRMIVNVRQMDLHLRENANNICESDSYFIKGSVFNDTGMSLNITFHPYNYNLESLGSDTTSLLNTSSSIYFGSNNILYKFRFSKPDLSNFTLSELATLKASLEFIPDSSHVIYNDSVIYPNLANSLKLLVNPNRTITISRKDSSTLKIDEDLSYGIITNNTGNSIKLVIDSAELQQPIEVTLTDTQEYEIQEINDVLFTFEIKNVDDSDIDSTQFDNYKENITYKQKEEEPIVIPPASVHYESLDQNLKERLNLLNFSYSLNLASSNQVRLVNDDGVIIYDQDDQPVTTSTSYFPACKFVCNFDEDYQLTITKHNYQGNVVGIAYSDVVTQPISITLDNGYYYFISLNRGALITPDYEEFTQADLPNLYNTIELRSRDDLADLEERVTTIEAEMQEISDLLDVINGGVV